LQLYCYSSIWFIECGFSVCVPLNATFKVSPQICKPTYLNYATLFATCIYFLSSFLSTYLPILLTQLLTWFYVCGSTSHHFYNYNPTIYAMYIIISHAHRFSCTVTLFSYVHPSDNKDTQYQSQRHTITQEMMNYLLSLSH
jgi:hypothetical protein